jgi:prepilin-type N-terminal cleavage/methylation domain-containing protein
MTQKGFTLMELLVVIAIIGILSAVGTYTLSGYLTNSKIKISTANHLKVLKLLEGNIQMCAAKIDIYFEPEGMSPYSFDCSRIHPSGYGHNWNADSHAMGVFRIVRYKFNNPYSSDESMFGGFSSTGHGWEPGAGWSNGTCSIPNTGISKGQSVLGYQGGPWCPDIACLKTNIGDSNGNDFFLSDQINLCDYD